VNRLSAETFGATYRCRSIALLIMWVRGPCGARSRGTAASARSRRCSETKTTSSTRDQSVRCGHQLNASKLCRRTITRVVPGSIIVSIAAPRLHQSTKTVSAHSRWGPHASWTSPARLEAPASMWSVTFVRPLLSTGRIDSSIRFSRRTSTPGIAS